MTVIKGPMLERVVYNERARWTWREILNWISYLVLIGLLLWGLA